MNTIQRVRLKTGITKPQMLAILQARPRRMSLFSAADAYIDPIFIDRAKELEQEYDEWSSELIRRVERANSISPRRLLHPPEVARLLNLSEFHLSQLRKRSQTDNLPPRAQRLGPRRYAYTFASLIDLVKYNSEAVSLTSNKTRGPLANVFLEWRADQVVKRSNPEFYAAMQS